MFGLIACFFGFHDKYNDASQREVQGNKEMFYHWILCRRCKWKSDRPKLHAVHIGQNNFLSPNFKTLTDMRKENDPLRF